MDNRDNDDEEILAARTEHSLADTLDDRTPKREGGTLYPNNILESFGTGALLDLRVRMAISILNTSPIFTGASSEKLDSGFTGKEWAKAITTLALDLATELMAESERRGLVEPLPDSDEIGDQLRKQAKRSASYNALMQIEGNKFIQAEQSRLSPPFPMAPRGPGRH